MADELKGVLDPNYLYRKKSLVPAASPVSSEKQAAATKDPRYAQAIGERIQADILAQQQKLQQQAQQFQTQFTESQQAAPSEGNVQNILEKIRSNTATESDIAQYQKIMGTQYKGPEALKIGANIAALRQMAQSPYALATAYTGFTPQRAALVQQQALGGLEKTGALRAGIEQAKQLGTQAAAIEQAAEQQVSAEKSEAEQLREQAKAGVQAERAAFLGELTEEQKADIEAKRLALEELQRGIFLGEEITQTPIQKLGLNLKDLVGLRGIDLGQIEGFETAPSSLEELKTKVTELEEKRAIEGDEGLTPEQLNFLDVYSQVSGLLTTQPNETQLEYYAGPENLARINALRALAGAPGETAPLTKEDLQRGLASGGISEEDLLTLKSTMTQEEENIEAEREEKTPEYTEKIEAIENALGTEDPDDLRDAAYAYLQEMEESNNTDNEIYRVLNNYRSLLEPHSTLGVVQDVVDFLPGLFGYRPMDAILASPMITELQAAIRDEKNKIEQERETAYSNIFRALKLQGIDETLPTD